MCAHNNLKGTRLGQPYNLCQCQFSSRACAAHRLNYKLTDNRKLKSCDERAGQDKCTIETGVHKTLVRFAICKAHLHARLACKRDAT